MPKANELIPEMLPIRNDEKFHEKFMDFDKYFEKI